MQSTPAGKWQRIAAYALIVVDDHILMVKLGKGPNRGRWGLPGGGVDFGEHPLASLEREIMEETGAVAQDFVLDNVISSLTHWDLPDGEEENMQNVGIVYTARTNGRVTVKADADGSSSLGSKWLALKELRRDEVSTVFQDYLMHKGLLPPL